MGTENIIKIGYFRRVLGDLSTSYISFKDFYANWSDDAKAELKREVDMCQCKLFCACCHENDLELSVTSNYVVRVKENRQQAEHMESCPKSKLYEHWNDTAENGVKKTEDERVVLNITLPNVLKSNSSSSSSSSSSTTSSPANKRTNIYECISMINKLAWEKQTFSIRKKIREANAAGVTQTWEYKDIDAFNRLIFGVSNDIFVRVRGEIIPFIALCYRKDLFYECDDWTRQWFMYAVIEKIGVIKQERKYQYVTVRMPSLNSPNKAVIRIETEIFNKIFDGFMEEKANMHRILAGYICRKSFKNDDGTYTEWMHFLKGNVCWVSSNGLICENETAANIANYMCDNHIVFKRPMFPLENYGGEIPTFMVERLSKKNIVLDVPLQEKLIAKRQLYIENNDEYDIVLLDEQNYKEKLEFLCWDKR